MIDREPAVKTLRRRACRSGAFGAVLALFTVFGCGRGERALEQFERGNALYVSQRLEEALPLFEKAIDLNRRHRQAYVMAAKCLYYLGREEEAMERLARVLRLFPRYTEALFWAGKVSYFMGEHEQAKGYLYGVLEEDGSHWDARFLLGDILFAEGDLERALLNFRLVASNLDLISLARVRLAELYVSCGEYQKALEEMAFIERNGKELGVETLGRAYELLSEIEAGALPD